MSQTYRLARMQYTMAFQHRLRVTFGITNDHRVQDAEVMLIYKGMHWHNFR